MISIYMRKFSSKKMLVALMLFLLSNALLASEGAARIEGKVSIDDRSTVLSVVLTNKIPDKAICIVHWPFLKDVVDVTYQDFLVVLDDANREADYISYTGDLNIESMNRSVVVVPPGDKVEANYELSALYKLKEGVTYTVDYYVEFYECAVYDSGWVYGGNPQFLKYLALEYGNDIEKIRGRLMAGNERGLEYYHVYRMETVEFMQEGPEGS